ncbi:MAG TPA: Cys-tRNA(Pro) deacylase [Desulfopila sp.]|nr:Cys-tRNA(Pro) deacylase [Desulfopila sp.]
MTPAVTSLKKAKIDFRLHRYAHDPDCSHYGEEAAVKLALDPLRVFKTLLAEFDDGSLVVALVPVSGMLDLKLLASHCRKKKARMAEREEVERTTGYLIGGVSPLAQKRRLATVIDISALDHETIYISAGRRGLDVELAPGELARLTAANFAVIAK